MPWGSHKICVTKTGQDGASERFRYMVQVGGRRKPERTHSDPAAFL